MSHTGAATQAFLGRWADGWSDDDWQRLGRNVPGVLLTIALVVVFDVLARHGMPVVHPLPILLFSVAISAYLGGTNPGLISATVAELYAVHFLSQPSGVLSYTRANAVSLVLMGTSAAGVAVLIGRLRAIAERARDAERVWERADALDRRLSFMSHLSSTLAATTDYEATMRGLARLTVPTMGDWCTVHLVGDADALRFVSGAHRDPARDLLVRALCEYGARRPPLADPGSEPRLLKITADMIRERAQDGEQLKLYRALAPSGLIQVPLRVGGRIAGVISLATAREYGRSFSEADLQSAMELGQRASLAIENVRLHRDALVADRRYRLLFEGNPQPMWVFDVDTLGFLAVNDAAVRFYGYNRDEFLGMTIMDIRPPDDVSGHPAGVDWNPHREGVALSQHQRKDGSVVDMEVVSHALELDGRQARLVLATDVSDRTRARAALHQTEERLRHAQRMDTVGRLATGVAHDFNNVLTTIRGFSDILRNQLPGESRQRGDVEQIRKAADRGALLTRQLLAFGSRQTLEPKVLAVESVIAGLEGLMRGLLGADIRLEVRSRPDAGAVRMDPAQLEQVVVNLLLNARDAMPSGGTLRLEIAERQVPDKGRGRHLRAGRYVMLAVRDTGAGIPPDEMPHLFESPARDDQRFGLGLFIVYGIVRRNGGVVRISSEPGRGTCVKIYLPRVEPEQVPVERLGELRGKETVLVVEDEEGVRELLRKVLVEYGHTVLEARHGRDALLVAERYERPIQLLITDVVMPEMGGAELARRMGERRPETKVLYVSGYTSEEVLRRGIRSVGPILVPKPFTPEDLMLRVRGVLDASEAPAT
jgi:PAS domain S-box-containing protein